MIVAGVGCDDYVLTTSNTFLASANCAKYVGAKVVFADIDPNTRCLSLETIQQVWRDGIKAVVAVDFAGYPCVSEELAEFVHAQGAVLIEDACHAIGGGRDGYKVGGLPWVDMTTFSFHPVKTMTTGEGGAVLSSNAHFIERLCLFRSHGMEKYNSNTHEAPESVHELVQNLHVGASIEDRWLYAVNKLGYNYRITDMQCALGLSQLGKLDGFVARRQAITDQYNSEFEKFPGVKTPPMGLSGFVVSWHLYVLEINFKAMATTREEFMARLYHDGVGTQVHYIPVHLQPYYMGQHGAARTEALPRTEAYYEQALSIPLYPSITDDEVRHVIATVTYALGLGHE